MTKNYIAGKYELTKQMSNDKVRINLTKNQAKFIFENYSKLGFSQVLLLK